MKRILNRIMNFISVVLLIVVCFIVFFMFKTKDSTNQTASILGYKPLSVLTGSMRPLLQPGDMIVAKYIKPENVKTGDIVVYKAGNNMLVTHRIIEAIKKGKEVLFKTKGDANNVADERLVSSGQLVGTLAFNVPYGGYIAKFIRSPKGFILFVIIPVILFIGGEIRKVIFESNKVKKEELNSESDIKVKN